MRALVGFSSSYSTADYRPFWGVDLDTGVITYITTGGETPSAHSALSIGFNDVVSFAVNPDTGNVWVGVNGVWSGGGDPAAGTNPALTGATGFDKGPCLYFTDAIGELITRVEHDSWAYTPPVGFQGFLQERGCSHGLFYWDNKDEEIFVNPGEGAEECFIECNTASAWRTALTSEKVSSGKVYIEFTRTTLTLPGGEGGGSSVLVGFSSADTLPENRIYWAADLITGTISKRDFSGTTNAPTSISASFDDVIQVALDLDGGNIWFGVNNTWSGGGNPATGTSPTMTGVSGSLGPFLSFYEIDAFLKTRIDSAGWAYTAPTDFYGLNDEPPSEEITPATPDTVFKWDNIAATLTTSPDQMTLLVDVSSGDACGLTTQTRYLGKFYWEYEITGGGLPVVGISRTGVLPASLGADIHTWAYIPNTGRGLYNGALGFVGDTYGVGDVIGVAVDLNQGKLWFSKNNVWQGANDPNPATDTSENYNNLSGDIRPAGKVYNAGSDAIELHVTPSQLTYTPPSGFLPLHDDYTFGVFEVAPEISGESQTSTLSWGRLAQPKAALSGAAENPIYAFGDFQVRSRIFGETGIVGFIRAFTPLLQGEATTTTLGDGDIRAPRPTLAAQARSDVLAYGSLQTRAHITGSSELPEQFCAGEINAPCPALSGLLTRTPTTSGDIRTSCPTIRGTVTYEELMTGRIQAPAPILSGTGVCPVYAWGNIEVRAKLEGSDGVNQGNIRVAGRISGTAVTAAVAYGRIFSYRAALQAVTTSETLGAGNIDVGPPELRGEIYNPVPFAPIQYDRFWRCNL